jgi:hypothetical protein
MSTRKREHGDALSTYRQSLASAMSTIFTASFFSVLRTLGCPVRRGCSWTLPRVIMMSLVMGWSSGQSLQDRFEESRECLMEMVPGRKRPGGTYQGYVKARGKIKGRQLLAIKDHFRDHHRRIAGPYWLRNGWLAFSVDGTRVEVPRTAGNEKAFSCAGRKKTGPQLSLTTLYHLGTGLPWAWQIGAGIESEQAQLHQMQNLLPTGSLLVADAGFTGFDLLRRLLAQGVQFLVRMGSNRTLLTGLEDVRVQIKGEVVWFWPKKKQSQVPPLKLRLVRIESANRSLVYVVTSVMDTDQLTDRQVAEFYRMRWGHEVFYRSFKRTLGNYRMRSGSPEEARRELDWAMMAYLTLGLLSVEGLIRQGQDPLYWSPAGSLRVIHRSLRSKRRFRRKGDLRVLLEEAVKDRYRRVGSKKARNWPHKKNDPPPGIPKIREAKEKEKHCAKRVYENMVAA